MRTATWNRHVATLRSFTAFARRRGWLTADPAGVLERRNEPADRTKAIARSSLERLFRREDVAIREKCLWRLLYETAARTQEVLCADIEDLDLDNKRLGVRRKGGDSDWLHFQSGSARLLPRLIGATEGRSSSPTAAPAPPEDAAPDLPAMFQDRRTPGFSELPQAARGPDCAPLDGTFPSPLAV